MKRIPRKFYNQDTLTIAKELLGKFLVHNCNGEKIIGKIVETEAYFGFKDKASHAAKGKTKRNYLMFGSAGYAYIYMIYGMYFCFNIVTEKKDYPAAVLIRAIEPIKNIKSGKTNGPGKLCRAMQINKELNGIDLCKNNLYLKDNISVPEKNIIAAKRIGIDYASEYRNKLWRFYIKI